MGLLTATCGSSSMGSATLFAGWSRALVALPEDTGSIPSTYTVASRHLSRQVHGIQCLFLTSTGVHTACILTLSHTPVIHIPIKLIFLKMNMDAIPKRFALSSLVRGTSERMYREAREARVHHVIPLCCSTNLFHKSPASLLFT